MTERDSTTHLLLGLLALQNDFISRKQLLSAFGAWIADKSRRIDELLVEQHAISQEDRRVLERLVDLHVQRNGCDVTQSLGRLSGMSSIQSAMAELARTDAEALQSLSFLPAIESNTLKSKVVKTKVDNFEVIARASKEGRHRFKIIRHHSQGGLGVVYLAEDLELHRQVALKQIREDRVDEDYRAKFRQEAEVTGQLEHPGIVPIYALGTDEAGRPYYAMRFIKGEDLRSRIRSFHSNRKANRSALDGPDLRALLRRFVDVCNALDYAHNRGVLHRDLKPGNIMLGKYGETLVVDWGLAKSLSPKENRDTQETTGINSEPPIANSTDELGSETRYGSVVGTPAYAPPEQLLGQLDRLCPASDVYGLGAILYEVITGQAPVSGRSLDDIIAIVTNGKILPPHSVEGAVPKPLEAICRKAMALRIEDRYPSAAELKLEIEGWLDDEAISVYRESVLGRTQRAARKNPATASAIAAALLFGLIGAAGYGLISTQHNRDLKKSNSEIAKKSDELGKSNEEIRKQSESLKERSASLRLANAKNYFATGILAFDDGHIARGSQSMLTAYALSDADPKFHAAVTQVVMDKLTFGCTSLAPPRFSSDIECSAFSPDGKYLTTVSRDGCIQCRDALTGQLINSKDSNLRGIKSIQFSSDGNHLITVSIDSSNRTSLIEKWLTRTLEPFGEPILESGYVSTIVISPNERRILTCVPIRGKVSVDRCQLRLWDSVTQKLLGSVIELEPRPGSLEIDESVIRIVKFNSDGSQFTTVDKNRICVWDADTGLLKMERALEVEKHSTAFSHDGQLLATTETPDMYSTIQVFRITDRIDLESTSGLKTMFYNLVFNPNGRLLSGVSFNQAGYSVLTLDLATLTPRGESIASASGFSHDFDVAPDGRTLAESTTGVIRHWEIATRNHFDSPKGSENSNRRNVYKPDGSRTMPSRATFANLIRRIPHVDLELSNRHIEFSMDRICNRIATIDKASVQIWDATSGVLIRSIDSDAVAFAFTCSPDGSMIAVAYLDKTVRIWDLNTGGAIGLPLRHEDHVGQLIFSFDGSRLVTVTLTDRERSMLARTGHESDSSTIREWKLWECPSGNSLNSGNIPKNYNWPSVVFSPNGKSFATLSLDGPSIWDSGTGKQIGDTLNTKEDYLSSMSFCPDSSKLITTAGVVRFWDVESAREIGKPISNGFIGRAVFNSSGTQVATQSSRGDTVAELFQVWDAQTHEQLGRPMRYDFRDETPIFNPNGTMLAQKTGDGSILLWDTMDNLQTSKTLQTSDVWCFAFSSDGRRLASCGSKSAILWDTETGMRIGRPMQSDQYPSAIAFASNGTRLVIETGNFTYIWDIESFEAPATESLTQAFLELLAHVQVDDDGQTLPLSREQEELRYKALEKDQKFWSKNRSLVERRIVRWHQQQAKEALDDRDIFACDFHLSHLKQYEETIPESERESIKELWSQLNAWKQRLASFEIHCKNAADLAAKSEYRNAAQEMREALNLLNDKSKKERHECTHQLISALVASGDAASLREAMDLLLGTDSLYSGSENYTSEFGTKWAVELGESWNLELALCLLRCNDEDRQRALVFAQTAYTRANEKGRVDPSSDWKDDAAYWNTTAGWIFASNGEFEMAKAPLLEAVKNKDHDFQDLLFLSFVLRDSADKTAASETLEKSIAKLNEHWDNSRLNRKQSWKDKICLEPLRKYIEEQIILFQ